MLTVLGGNVVGIACPFRMQHFGGGLQLVILGVEVVQASRRERIRAYTPLQAFRPRLVEFLALGIPAALRDDDGGSQGQQKEREKQNLYHDLPIEQSRLT